MNEVPQRMNYVFVDYDNVPDIDLSLIRGKPVKVFIIVGLHATKLPTKLVTEAQKLTTDQAEWLRCECAGRNALDLVLACHLGQVLKDHPSGYFHIVSRDKDFDPLVTHLKAGGVLAKRAEVFAEIAPLVDWKKKSVQERAARVKELLGAQADHQRPRTLKKLLSWIDSHFKKVLTVTDVAAIRACLEKMKVIAIGKNEVVSYPSGGLD